MVELKCLGELGAQVTERVRKERNGAYKNTMCKGLDGIDCVVLIFAAYGRESE